MAPLRFLLVSTHTDQMTGYSKVAYNLLKQLATLQPLVKVFHFGFQRAPMKLPKPFRPIPEGIIQYDAALNEEPREEGFGFNKFKEYTEMINPDIVMIYNDALVINRFLNALQLKDEEKPPFKVWVYLDQVYKNCAGPLVQNIEKYAERIFTFTDAWKDHLLTLMDNKEIPIMALEHGIDKSIYRPIPHQERLAVRSGMGIPADAKVFLNVNRNSERKRLDLSIMSFVEVIRRNPTFPYYLIVVTGARLEFGGTYDVQGIYLNELKRAGLTVDDFLKRIVIVDTSPPNLLTDESVNHIYNAADVGLNTSNGEGYGLCQLEHLATGAPQAVVDVGDYHAFMDEETAVFVKPTEFSYLPARFGLGLIAESCTVAAFADGMERALTLSSEKCIKKVQKKTWARMIDPFLELISQSCVKN